MAGKNRYWAFTGTLGGKKAFPRSLTFRRYGIDADSFLTGQLAKGGPA